MFEGFKPNKAETTAINNAWYLVQELTGNDYRSFKFMKEETLGYGNKSDRIPQTAAKGLCVTWFLAGIEKPDALLADNYFCRPASIWFKGYGASKAYAVSIEAEKIFEDAKSAYDAAFKRMISSDRS